MPRRSYLLVVPNASDGESRIRGNPMPGSHINSTLGNVPSILYLCRTRNPGYSLISRDS
jgi:hypothetical protein